jgi:hypothetical protein
MALDFPSSPTVGQEYASGNRIWRWNGTTWVVGSSNLYASSLDDIGDVDLTGVTSGEFLKYDGTDWVADAVPTINTLNDVGDVDTTGASSGEFLKWDGTNWVADSIPTINALDDVGNVSAATPASGDFLRYDGSNWSNDAINSDDVGEGSTNLYYTDTRARGAVNADLSGAAGGTRFVAPSSSSDVQLISHEATHAVIVQSDGIVGAKVIIKGSAQVIASASIADPGNLTVAGTVSATDVTVTGDLTVSGTTTSLNTTELTVEDNIITLNSGATGAPTLNAGIEIERGSSTNVALRWNETSDKWEITTNGSTYDSIATAGDVAGVAISSLDDIGDVSIASAASGDVLTWNGSAWVNDSIIGGATVSSSAPTGLDEGAIWFDSDTGQTYVYYDAAWVEIGGSYVGARLTVSSEAPAGPLEGEMWFDSDTAQTFVYYDGVWVEISGSNTGLASLDDVGDVNVASATSGQFLKWDGTEWVADDVPTINTLDDIGDVTITSVANGQVLTRIGGAWVNATPTGGDSLSPFFLMGA